MVIDSLVIRRAMRNKGLFIKELARDAGISYSSARLAINSGKGGLRVARAIAKALDLEIKDVISPFHE